MPDCASRHVETRTLLTIILSLRTAVLVVPGCFASSLEPLLVTPQIATFGHGLLLLLLLNIPFGTTIGTIAWFIIVAVAHVLSSAWPVRQRPYSSVVAAVAAACTRTFLGAAVGQVVAVAVAAAILALGAAVGQVVAVAVVAAILALVLDERRRHVHLAGMTIGRGLLERRRLTMRGDYR
jgi:hypothetical protein